MALSLLESIARTERSKEKVTDESGKPLAGATVTIKGTNLTAAAITMAISPSTPATS